MMDVTLQTPSDSHCEIEVANSDLTTLDNWHGPLAALCSASVIGSVILFAESVRINFGRSAYLVVLILVCIPLVGARQRALATLLHESAHKTLAKNDMLNRALGTVMSGYWIFQTRSAYQRSHVRDHHGNFGDPDRDPDLASHLRRGLYDPSLGKCRFVGRFLVRPLTGLDHPRMLKELIAVRFGSLRRTDEPYAVILFHGVIIVSLSWAGLLYLYLIYWIVPLLVVFPVVNWYAELLEHFPGAFSTNPLYQTRHRHLGILSRQFLGVHKEGFHLDHHLSVKVPFWQLPNVHRQRVASLPGFREAVDDGMPRGPWRRLGVLGQFVRLIEQREEWVCGMQVGTSVEQRPSARLDT
jgi:fatty acid desaturase